MHLYRKGEASQIERGGTTRKEWSLLTNHTLYVESIDPLCNDAPRASSTSKMQAEHATRKS